MNIQHPNHTHPVVQVLKNFVSKLIQNPEVYPIKYYKKGNRLRKNDKHSIGK